jgi:hypothetical protein
MDDYCDADQSNQDVPLVSPWEVDPVDAPIALLRWEMPTHIGQHNEIRRIRCMKNAYVLA